MLVEQHQVGPFIDERGVERPLTHADVLVIAPFNRHGAALANALPGGVRVGTADKLQGQEAPVVLYALGVEELPADVEGLRLVKAHVRLVRPGVATA